MKASPDKKGKDAKFDLREGPILGHVLRMLGPFSLAIVALLSAGIIDTIYLGNLEDPERPGLGVMALAAIGIAYPLTFLGNSANIGLGAGTMSAVSRAIGAGNEEQARRRGASAVFFALAIMTVIVAALILIIPVMVPQFSDDPAVISMAKTYLYISLPGLVIVSISMICNNLLRARGEALLPSSITILGAIINIILDPFLIFGWGPFPRMEVQGAAIATVAGHVIAATYGLYLVNYYKKAVSFVGMNWQSFKRSARIIADVGVPAMCTNIIVPVGTAVAVWIIGSRLSTEDLAAFTLTSRAELLSVGVLYALSACIGAITGQNGGAGKTERVRATFKVCYWVCFVWSTLLAIIMAIFGSQIADVFTNDPSVVAKSVSYFLIVPVTIFAYGFVFVSAAGLNALGRPRYGLVYTIIRSLLLYTSLVYVGVQLDGLRGAFIGIAAANIISGLIAFYWTMYRTPMTVKKSTSDDSVSAK